MRCYRALRVPVLGSPRPQVPHHPGEAGEVGGGGGEGRLPGQEEGGGLVAVGGLQAGQPVLERKGLRLEGQLEGPLHEQQE